MKKRFTQEQIIKIIQEAQGGLSVKALCRKIAGKADSRVSPLLRLESAKLLNKRINNASAWSLNKP